MNRAAHSSAIVIRFLLHHGVLRASAVVDGRLSVFASARDRFVLHEVRDGDVVVCMAKTARHPSAAPFLAAEGAVLDYFQRHRALSGIGPRCLAREAHGYAVALEHVAPAAPAERPDAEVDATAMADVLGSLHRHTTGAELGVTMTLPPVFDAVFLGRTPNPQALARLWTMTLEPSSLLRGLERTARAWQPQTLIHTDVKREHWMRRPHTDHRDLCLIDWELTRTGDPAWDVGSVLHDYLRQGETSAASVFLQRYRATAGDRVWNHDFAHRVALCTATRSVQTALETLGTGSEWDVSNLLRKAEIVFRDPEAFAAGMAQALDVSRAA